jgi:malate dehydrogenase (oxaloacetate-decarboxylating)(NADP+)
VYSAAISTHLLEELAGGIFIGPILDGFEYPVQIVTMGASASDILKVSAFAAIDAINAEKLKKIKETKE